MSEPTPSAILAAAKALMRRNTDGLPEWRDLDERTKAYWRDEAKAALAAARPGVLLVPVEHLVALPVGTVVLNSQGRALQKRGNNDRWYMTGVEGGTRAPAWEPFRVIYRPEET